MTEFVAAPTPTAPAMCLRERRPRGRLGTWMVMMVGVLGVTGALSIGGGRDAIVKPTSPGKIEVLSLNVCFETPFRQERSARLVEVLRARRSVDVVCLQEIRQDLAQTLREKLGEEFHVSPEPQNGQGYFTLTLVRRDSGLLRAGGAPPTFTRKSYSVSSMGRDVLMAEFPDWDLVVGNTHLESLDNPDVRVLQAKELVRSLSHREHAVVMGDFNICSHVDFPDTRRSVSHPRLEEDDLSEVMSKQSGFLDVWKALHPGDDAQSSSSGNTYVPATQAWKGVTRAPVVPGYRFDRCFVRGSSASTEISLSVEETVPFARLRGREVLVSDHFALLVSMSL